MGRGRGQGGEGLQIDGVKIGGGSHLGKQKIAVGETRVKQERCIWVAAALRKTRVGRVWRAWGGLGLCEKLCGVMWRNAFEIDCGGKTLKGNLT